LFEPYFKSKYYFIVLKPTNKAMTGTPTITIESVDKSEITFKASRILFFWQKIVVPDSLVTQIVCTTDECNHTDPQKFCQYVYDIDPRTGPFNPDIPIRNRTVVDTPLTLDEMLEKIESLSTTPIPHLTAHRAFTRHDSRVVFPEASSFGKHLLMYMIYMFDRDRKHGETRRGDYKGFARDGGGDGLVNDYPRWWLPTHDRFGIYLVDTAFDAVVVENVRRGAYKEPPLTLQQISQYETTEV
jgi:hypothetical protein